MSRKMKEVAERRLAADKAKAEQIKNISSRESEHNSSSQSLHSSIWSPFGSIQNITSTFVEVDPSIKSRRSMVIDL